MKNFLRVYFASTVLFLFIVLACAVVTDGQLLRDLWLDQVEEDYFPILFITSGPVFLSCLSVLIAKGCTYKTPFIQWNKKSLSIDSFLLLLFIGFTAFFLYLFGVYRDVNSYNPKIPEEIYHVILTLLVAIGTAFSIIFLKDGLARLKEEKIANKGIEPEKEERGFASNYFAVYYIFSLLLVVVYGLVTVGYNVMAYARYDVDPLLLIHLGFFVLSSAIVALGAYFSEKLYTYSCFISQLISIGTILLFLISFGLVIALSIHVWWDDKQDITFKGFSKITYGEFDEGDADYYDEHDDYYEEWDEEGEETFPDPVEYEGEVKEFSFDFLWDDPEDDLDSVKMAVDFMDKRVDPQSIWTELQYLYQLPYDNEDEDYWFKERFGMRGGIAYYRIANFIYNFEAHTHLPSILDAYIHILPWYLSRDTYNKNYRQTVDLLLATYEELMEDAPNYRKFAQVHELMNFYPDEGFKNYDEHQEYRFNQLASITNISQRYKEYPFSKGYVDKTYASWGYSFWGRRYDKGNHQDVYYILQAINSKFPLE